MSTQLFAGIAAVVLFSAACGGSRPRPSVTPTFTPETSATSSRAALPPPAHPVVGRDCLRGLTSYRFGGSFALHSATPVTAATPPAGEGTGLSGSLANLLSNITFEGAAQAPDRYQAQVRFGGQGVQRLQIIRIGDQTFSRFGNNPWQRGDQIQGFGGIAQFDPQTLCENILTSLDAGGQTPAHETVNGVPALRYDLSGPQLSRILGGQQGGSRAQTATPVGAASQGTLTVWQAEKGGFPVRFQVNTVGGTGSIDLRVDITDINGKDVQVSPPA